MMVVAAWFRYIQRHAEDPHGRINDPLEQDLLRAARSAADDAELVRNLLQISAVFGDLPTGLIADELIDIAGRLAAFDDTGRLEGRRI